MNTHLLLEMAAQEGVGRIAVGSLRDGLSYGELLAAAKSAADWINDLDIENVVYAGLNAADFPVALFASAIAGKPFVPLNYRLPDADLRKLVARVAPCVAVLDDDVIERIGSVSGMTAIRKSDFLAFIEGRPAAEAADETPDDVAVLLFTSGTTGEPKAAMLRHRHLVSYVISTLDFMGAEEDEATLVSVPPYHIAGISAVLTSVYSGRRMVQLSAFTPEEWVSMAAAERVTHAMMVPTMLGRVLDILEGRGEKLLSLKHLSYGGGRMPVTVIERALALLPHVNFVNAYGLTETSSTISVLTPQDHRDALAGSTPQQRLRLGSVGRPLPTLEIEIRDGNGLAVEQGNVGEVWVRGEQVSGEYVGGSALREDGWFPTRDNGYLDADGFLYIEGRLDDVIVRGGENISPGEIEEVLRSHPLVNDAAVIGLPDDEWGERIIAVIISEEHPAIPDLKEYVRSRLRSTRVPEDIIFRAELPYNETGKLLRRVLKAEILRAI
jgi:fatty-acyl-CoA synthase